jgi:signal peptidase II
MNRRLAGIALGIVVLLADQASKFWVLHNITLTSGDIINILPVLDFVLVWNHGVALAVVTGLTVWLWNTPRLITTLAIGAIAGGAVGNVLDRLRYGAVVDFIQAHIGMYSFYVFNVGDSAIVCGVGVLMAESILRKTPAEPAPLQPNAGGDRKAP